MEQGSASLVVAGNLSQDLLSPSTWRMSNHVKPPRSTPYLSRNVSTKRSGCDAVGNWFLEGNVVGIHDELYVSLRTRIDVQLTAGMTSVCKLEDDGQKMKYRFLHFYPMPGGQNKFKILYGPVSQLYWTCTPVVPDPCQDPKPLTRRGFAGNPGNMRRLLIFSDSINGLNWLNAGCVAMSRNPLESFHYSSPIIDRNDFLVLARSSTGAKNSYQEYHWTTDHDEGKGKLPYDNHNSNLITLHRVKSFRSLAVDLRQNFSYTAAP